VARKEGKRSLTSHIEKQSKLSASVREITEEDVLATHVKTSTEIQSTPLISNKENHTFITHTGI
jgi:hypothetical protein